MKRLISLFIQKSPSLLLFFQLFRSRIGAYRTDLQSIHNMYALKSIENTLAVDLGCGVSPQNRFNASRTVGVDIVGNKDNNVVRCELGFEPLPFDNVSVDYLTAYDLIEHIPRFSNSSFSKTPFIFFMNECFRVLKSGGVFLSMTPVYPYLGAFQDPTHNNIMTIDTLKLYFSDQKLDIARHYGITADFKMIDQKMYGQHLIAVLTK